MLITDPPLVPTELLREAIDQNGGRNSVDLPDGRRVDLQGKPHFDKATGKDVECPHTHDPQPQFDPPYQDIPRGPNPVPRPSTIQDIQDVISHLGSTLLNLIVGPPPPQTINSGHQGPSA